jgi:hypothetical protein
MGSESSTQYTRDVLTQMSDKQIDDAASKIKRLIRETERRISSSKNKKDNKEDGSVLRGLEVEFCYVDDEKQRRQKFNQNRSSRRSS